MDIEMLKITCVDNPDWHGSWMRHEVEQEMRELGQKDISKNDWLNWVLFHVFDCELDAAIETCITECDSVQKLVFELDGCKVIVEKL